MELDGSTACSGCTYTLVSAVTNAGARMVVDERSHRSIKRLRNKRHAELISKPDHCAEGSRLS